MSGFDLNTPFNLLTSHVGCRPAPETYPPQWLLLGIPSSDLVLHQVEHLVHFVCYFCLFHSASMHETSDETFAHKFILSTKDSWVPLSQQIQHRPTVQHGYYIPTLSPVRTKACPSRTITIAWRRRGRLLLFLLAVFIMTSPRATQE